jgi:endonuclease/exonuclease/phosphatase family metal-dependent hydrolase
MRRLVLVFVAVAACGVDEDAGGPWTPAESIDGLLAPELGPAPAPRAAPAILRIATWNVAFGADPDGFAAAIAGSHELASADVLLIQEIENHPDEPGTRASRLATALGMTWVYAPGRPKDDGTHGIAILSRFPLSGAEVMTLPRFQVMQERRIALAATVEIGAARLRIVDVHLDVRLNAAERIRQLDPAVDTTAFAFGGDFNSAPWSWIEGEVPLFGTEAIVGQETPEILDDYLAPLDFHTAIPPGEHTLTRLPVRCDDLYTHGTPPVAAGVEHVDGSDHWPVWIDVALPDSP